MRITVNDLVKKYRDLYAVDHVNFSFHPGIYALLGPNGAGKTTLIDMVSTVLHPTKGQILLDGSDVFKLGGDYRSIIGYLPQNPPFYNSFAVKDFLKYIALLKAVPQNRIKEEIDRVLSFVHLEEAADKKIATLSGGMRQRLGIAQAVMNDPSIIILDEPTAGLDPKERIHLKNIIACIAKERIIIISTHIVSDVEELAQQVIMMDKGKIIIADAPSRLTDSLKGKVWLVYENQNYQSHYVVRWVKGDEKDQSAPIRLIADGKPCEDAEMVQPTLDDVYLYHFGREEGEE